MVDPSRRPASLFRFGGHNCRYTESASRREASCGDGLTACHELGTEARASAGPAPWFHSALEASRETGAFMDQKKTGKFKSVRREKSA